MSVDIASPSRTSARTGPTLTAAGRRQLRQERSEWADFVRAVARVLKPAGESES